MKYQILKLLTLPVDPHSQRKELNSLIEDCFRYATVQVKYQLMKLHKPGITGDLTAKDIAVDAIAKRIKEVNLAYENPVITCQDTDTEYDIEQISFNAQHTVIEKLRHSYLEKGKLSEDESRMIESAFQEIMADLKDGGVRTGLYHYIEIIDNSIIQDMYKQKYHNILEYLLKVMKKELVHLLSVKNELSE